MTAVPAPTSTRAEGVVGAPGRGRLAIGARRPAGKVAFEAIDEPGPRSFKSQRVAVAPEARHHHF